jgi:hypothetical protein
MGVTIQAGHIRTGDVKPDFFLGPVRNQAPGLVVDGGVGCDDIAALSATLQPLVCTPCLTACLLVVSLTVKGSTSVAADAVHPPLNV